MDNGLPLFHMTGVYMFCSIEQINVIIEDFHGRFSSVFYGLISSEISFWHFPIVYETITAVMPHLFGKMMIL